jgi:hypothetical protein
MIASYALVSDQICFFVCGRQPARFIWVKSTSTKRRSDMPRLRLTGGALLSSAVHQSRSHLFRRLDETLHHNS